MAPTRQAAEVTRILPNNQEAEQALLGVVLLDDSVFSQLSPVLQAREFYREAHHRIYGAFTSLSVQRIPIDLITVMSELRRAEALEQCGGAAYLASLTDGIPGAMNVDHYAQEIRETANRRRIIQLANEIMTSG